MKEIFGMTRKGLNYYTMISKVEESGDNQVKAAELLGISDRHFRRLLKAYRERGAEALQSKQIGKSNRSIKADVRLEIVKKLRTKYKDCGPRFAAEKLVKIEKIQISHETVRTIMMREGLWEPRRKKKLKLHQQRMRRDHEGELIQVDGSPHDWFEGRGPKCCLLGFIDDATSKIQHLEFVKAESTQAYLRSMKTYMALHGRPQAFYTDRLNVFRVNNAKDGYRRLGLTQVGRALKEVGVELICANSPQAKGRVERMFNTLQDRLIKELRLRGISCLEDGNKYLPEYIEEHNVQFSVTAAKPDNKHIRVSEEMLEHAFCCKEERILSKNLEISYEGRILQVIAEEAGYALRRAKVVVIEDLTGRITIEYQGRVLKYKELLVRDRQGRVANKKEILLGIVG